MKQLVRPERGPIEIDPTVVIEVTHGDAHAVSVGLQSTLPGHIGEVEGARAIGVHHEVVPIESIRQRPLRRSEQRRPWPEPPALNEVDVEVAVVVVIEHRDAGPHDFGLIEPAGHAVEMGELNPRRRCAIDEPLFVACVRPDGGCLAPAVRGLRWFGRWRAGPRHAGNRSATQDEQEQGRGGRTLLQSHAHHAISRHSTSQVRSGAVQRGSNGGQNVCPRLFPIRT